MPCTTLLAGRNATYDGSTMMARNEDSGAGHFTPKKLVIVRPEDQPKVYRSVLSGVEIPLPEKPMRYSAVPNALPDEGIWGEAGVNECNVAMSETETITSNARVLGADPLVKGGIGEEDLLTIVLPYIHSAREGVQRLGKLLETYGTYEMNGIGFQDTQEVWWLESIGGHHWIAKRVPDDAYVVMPNQQGIDSFDFLDAFGEQRDHLCSADLAEWIRENHLDLRVPDEDAPVLEETEDFDVRAAFGSREDADHSYNTPRAWAMLRYLNPRSCRWDGPNADYTPEDDDLPWSLTPEHLITVEDVKYVLSNHFQGTPYDPYGKYGDLSLRGKYRPIGVNRNNFVALTQLRPNRPRELAAIQWIAMGSNVFNAFVPFFPQVDRVPEYLGEVTGQATTEALYWVSRIIAALADAHFSRTASAVERYQKACAALGQRGLKETEAGFPNGEARENERYLEERNREMTERFRAETDRCLNAVLFESSLEMRNAYSRSDA